MSTECNQFVFGFHPLRSARSSTVERSPVMAVVYSFGRSRSASGSSTSLPLVSLIIGMRI